MQTTKDQAINKLESGWHNLVEKVFEIEKQLPFCSGIAEVSRTNGMLMIRFVRADILNDYQRFILDALEYKFERISAKLCEGCGKHGVRRKDLPEIQTLCTTCYALKYSEVHTFVPPKVANQEPQID
jgi:hypothetical protein